jgi:hypothetical protein
MFRLRGPFLCLSGHAACGLNCAASSVGGIGTPKPIGRSQFSRIGFARFCPPNCRVAPGRQDRAGQRKAARPVFLRITQRSFQ